MAKKLSGWCRMFIVFAVVWTIISTSILYSFFPDKEYIEDVKIAKYLFPFYWLVPIGFVYGLWLYVGWIIKGFRKDKERKNELLKMLDWFYHWFIAYWIIEPGQWKSYSWERFNKKFNKQRAEERKKEQEKGRGDYGKNEEKG